MPQQHDKQVLREDVRLTSGDADGTGTFEAIDRIAHVETDRGAKPVVYGLGIKKGGDQALRERKATVRMVVGALLAALALLAYFALA